MTDADLDDDRLLSTKITPSKRAAPPALRRSPASSLSPAPAAAGPPSSPPAKRSKEQDAAQPAKDAGLGETRYMFFNAITALNHLPEDIVWGSDSVSFRALRWAPALVVTERNIAQLLSVRATLECENERLLSSNKEPWVVRDPGEGKDVVVVFIYDKVGPKWNLARLAAGKWEPFKGFEGAAPEKQMEIQERRAPQDQKAFESNLKGKKRREPKFAKEFAGYVGSLKVAEEMFAKAEARQAETRAMLNASHGHDLEDELATLPSSSQTSTQPQEEFSFKTEGVLTPGDYIGIQQGKLTFRAKVLSVQKGEFAIGLSGSAVLQRGEPVLHSGTWRSWESMPRAVSDAVALPDPGANPAADLIPEVRRLALDMLSRSKGAR